MQGGLWVAVEAVELHGPGLAGWEAARAVLGGAEEYRTAPVSFEPPAALPPAERRRAIASVKLALAVGLGATAASGLDPASLPAVFASSGADGETIHAILAALAAPGRDVSPTRFHNSVHNAPSGYWGMAVQSREPVTSLSGYDESFASGLLEAAAQAVSGDRPVLLVAYDLPYPAPLDALRPVGASFATALVLSVKPSARARAGLGIALSQGSCDQASRCADPGLEALRQGNPAARSLPLLAAIASRASASIRLELPHGLLEVRVAPC